MTFSSYVAATPNFWVYGCAKGNVSYGLPFCTISLPISERVLDLIGRLSEDEKLVIDAFILLTRPFSVSSSLPIHFCNLIHI
jgi:hypothetical protein